MTTDTLHSNTVDSPIEVVGTFELYVDVSDETLIAAAEVHTGAMIALVPSADDAQRLALEGFEAPEQLHLTLVYLGDAVDFSDEARERIVDIVKRYAADPITTRAFAVNVFNPDGEEPALVLGVGNAGGADLEALRSNIYSAVRGAGGFQVAENHTPWVPHVTLAYSEHPHELVTQAAERVGPVTFDRVRVAFGSETTDVPLSAKVSATPEGSTMTTFQLVDLSTANLIDLDTLELALAVEAARERDVNAPGGGHDLRNYWVRGPGAAKIRWGTDGSFARCVANMSKYVKRPQGLCAEYHKAATGEWPAEKGVESSMDTMMETHGHHTEDGELVTAAARKKKNDEDKMTAYADEPWEGPLVVEGVESGDGRMFALGSLDWADLPMPLMYQPANVGGHNESFAVGEITHAARRGNEIRGWGTVFGTALNGEHGDGIRNTMKVGGVSVDVDAVKDANVEMVYAESEGGANPFAKPEMTIFHEGRIRGATLVAFPAFVEAKLKFTGVLAASAEPESCGCKTVGENTVLTASAADGESHTITIPNLPPAHWFNEPTDVESFGALTITDEGRVFGVVAPPNTTHRSVNRKVPRNVDFTRFHKGETIVQGGGRVVTGVITADCGHAPTENYGTLERRRLHYDNSCSVLANVRVGYAKDGGIWVGGALNPGADPAQVAKALGCALSLDVQPHPDRPGIADFLSAHLVPVPGFAQARTKPSVQYSEGVLVAAAVPVNYTNQPQAARVDVLELARSKKLALAQSIGRDPETRKFELRTTLGR